MNHIKLLKKMLVSFVSIGLIIVTITSKSLITEAYQQTSGNQELVPFQFSNTLQIKNANHDVMVSDQAVNFNDGGIYLSSKFVDNRQYANYLYFENLNLPSDAVIEHAYLDFTMLRNVTSPTTFRIDAEVADSLALQNTVASYSQRVFTNKSIISEVGTGIQANQKWRSEDLAEVMQTRLLHSQTGSVLLRLQGEMSGDAIAYSFDSNANFAPQLVIEYSSNYGRSEIVVNSRNDNAEEHGQGHGIELGGFLELGGYWSTTWNSDTEELSGLRFTNVHLPKEAEIKDAYIEFTTSATNATNTVSHQVIRMEQGNASTYSSTPYEISKRQYGEQAIRYNQDTFKKVNEVVRTPNLKNIIDENRLQGWNNGEAMAFSIHGDSYIGHVYPTGYAQAPRLVIEFENTGRGAYVEKTEIEVEEEQPANVEGMFHHQTSSTIKATNDDAVVSPTGVDFGNGGVPLQGRTQDNIHYDNYLRFNDLDLPDDAIVTNAYLQFTTREASTKPTSFKVYSEIGKGEAFQNTVSDFNTRVFSEQSVSTTTPASVKANEVIKSNNLAKVINEKIQKQNNQNLVLKLVGDDIGRMTMQSFNGNQAQAPKLVIEYSSNYGKVVTTVKNRNDNAEEYGRSHAIDLGGSSLDIGGYHSTSRTSDTEQVVGLRFSDIILPADAEIKEAYIEYTANATNAQKGVSNQTIRLEQGDAAAYTNKAYDVSKRTYGKQTLTYKQETFKTANSVYKTADLRKLIDESRLNGWQSGQSLAFMIDGDYYIGNAYQAGTSNPPKLVIKYENTKKGPGEIDTIEEEPEVKIDPQGKMVMQTQSVIKNANDDATYSQLGGVNLNDASVYMQSLNDDLRHYDNYLRFTDINLPSDTIVTNAYIEFSARDTSTKKSSFKVYIEDGKGEAFTNQTSSILNRNFMESYIQDTTPAQLQVNETWKTKNLATLMNQRLQGNTSNSFVFKVVGDDIGKMMMHSYNSNPQYAPKLVIEYASDYGRSEIVVNSRNDNAEEHGQGHGIELGGFLELGGYWSTTWNSDTEDLSGLRFTNVQLPKEAEIKDAYIEFTTSATNATNTVSHQVIRMEQGNAQAYTAIPYMLSKRQYGEQAIRYNQDTFKKVNEVVRTPNLKNIIDENRLQGWNNGEAMAFSIHGDSYIGHVYPTGYAQAPRLVIEFENTGRGAYVEKTEIEVEEEQPANVEGMFHHQTSSTIKATNDDAVVSPTGVDFGNGGVPLQGRTQDNIHYDNYLRFNDLDLPDDAIVTNAYLQFTTREASTKPTSFKVYSEIGKGEAFQNTVSDFNTRVFSEQSVSTTTPASVKANEVIKSNNLAKVINEKIQKQNNQNLVLKLVGDDIGRMTMQSFNGNQAQAPKLVIEYSSNYGKVVTTVKNRNDNAEEYGRSHAIDLGGSSLDIGGYHSTSRTSDTEQVVGLRFSDIILPADAEIKEAYIEYTANATNAQKGVSNQTIRLEQGDAAAYTNKAYDVSKRTYGKQTLTYKQETFKTANSVYKTADLRKLIDESRLNGWQSGQSLAFMIDGDYYIGNAYQAGTSNPPKLVIKYENTKKGPGEIDTIEEEPEVKIDPQGKMVMQTQSVIKNANDDATYSQLGGVNLNDASVYMQSLNDDLRHYDNYLRFTDINLPSDTIVTNAYIEFSARDTSTKKSSFKVYIEDGKGEAFTNQTSSILNRNFMESYIQDTTPAQLQVNETWKTKNLATLMNQRLQGNTSNSFVFKVVGDDIGKMMMHSYNSNPQYAPKLVIEYASDYGRSEIVVNSRNDNAEEHGQGHGIELGGFLELGGYWSTTWNSDTEDLSGLRFTNVQLPKEAEIKDAYIEFTTSATNATNTVSHQVIRMEQGNAQAYTAIPYMLSKRQYGEQAIRYNQDTFKKVNEVVRTPNLKNIIDENRLQGWNNGEAMAFSIHGDSYIGHVYPTGYAQAPRLVIEFENTGRGAYVEKTEIEVEEEQPANVEGMFHLRTSSTIKATNDDAVVSPTGVDFGNGGVPLQGRMQDNIHYDNYLRFNDLDLPDDAIVTNAYLQFTTREASTKPTSFKVYSEIGKGEAFQNTVSDFNTRVFSEQSVSTTTPASVKANEVIKSNNLAKVINEKIQKQNNQNLVLKLVGDDIGRMTMQSFNGNQAQAPKLVIEYSSNYGKSEIVVNSRNDNAEEHGQGHGIELGGFLELGGYWSTTWNSDTEDLSGLRFTNVQLPKEAEIKDAYIEFTTSATNATNTVSHQVIRMEQGNASTYSSTPYEISKRQYGEQAIRYNQDTFKKVNEVVRTPNLKNIIDENRLQGWNNGEAMAFSIHGDSYIGHVYPTGYAQAPRLVIEFENTGRGAYVEKTEIEVEEEQPANVEGMFHHQTSSTIKATNDDVVVSPTGVDFGNGGVPLQGRTQDNIHYDNYLRFNDLDLPDDAIVTNAYLQFTTREASTKPTSFKVYSEIGKGEAFQNTVSDFNTRVFSEQSVSTTTPASVKANEVIKSNNLAKVINEKIQKQNNQNLVLKLVGDDIGRMTMQSFNGNQAQAPKLVIEYSSNYGKVVTTVKNRNDNAEEYGTAHAIDLGGSGLEIGGYFSTVKNVTTEEVVGLRFNDIVIPDDAEIEDAYIEFTSLGVTASKESTNMQIRVEVGDALAYTSALNNVSNRNYTQLAVHYSQAAINQSNQVFRTANLKDIIDENRMYGWKSNQALAFLVTGDNYLGNVYPAGYAQAPKLVITYKNTKRGPFISNAIDKPSELKNIYVNEVSAEGTKNSQEAWVELYNDNDVPVVLKDGVYLATSTKKPQKQALNNVVIPAKGYRILIDDATFVDNPSYVNLDMSSSGSIYLNALDSKGSVKTLDVLAYDKHLYNETFAREIDGSKTIKQFVEGSYKESNQKGKLKYVVAVSHGRGVYDGSFDLSLTPSTSNMKIRYTLDGSVPNETKGTLYTTPIKVDKNMVVTYYGFDDKGNTNVQVNTYILKSNLKNETYFQYRGSINDEEYAKALQDFPIVSLSGDSAGLNPDIRSQVSFEYFDANQSKNFFSYGGAKKKGQHSAGYFNSGLTVKFHRDYNTKKAKYNFFDEQVEGDAFGIASKYSSLELKEGQDGPQFNAFGLGYLRYNDKITNDLVKNMGSLAPSTRYVHYFYNGRYMGLKTLKEDFDDQMFATYFGGDNDEYTEINFQDGYFPGGTVEFDKGNPQLWEDIKKTVVSKDLQKFKQYVDLKSLIDTQIIFMLTDNENEMRGLLHNDVLSGQAKMMMKINDTDGAFYNNDLTGEGASGLTGGGGTYRFKWLYNTMSQQGAGQMFGTFAGIGTPGFQGNLEFKTLVKDEVLSGFGSIYADLSTSNTPISIQHLKSMIETNVKELDASYKLDAAYMSFGNNLYQNWVDIQPKIMNQLEDRVSFNLNKWKEFGMAHTLREIELVSDSFATFVMNPNENTKLYYTLDGSDPMGANGVISASAIEYNETSNLGNQKYIFRPYTTNNWGPKTIVENQKIIK